MEYRYQDTEAVSKDEIGGIQSIFGSYGLSVQIGG
jgi:hypothetical protein